MTRCPACAKATLRRGRIEERMFGVSLGEFDAAVCPACGESYLEEGEVVKLEARARKAGVWGLGKKIKIARSGNSLVLRIPSDLAKFLKLKAGSEVFVHPEGDDRIVVDVED